MYIQAFLNKQCAVLILPKHFVEGLSNWKKFFGCLILPRIVGQMRQSPCFILNIFTIWTKWVTTPDMCVIYTNSMIYPPVQFYALCQVLSGVILSFNTKFLTMPRTLSEQFKKAGINLVTRSCSTKMLLNCISNFSLLESILCLSLEPCLDLTIY